MRVSILRISISMTVIVIALQKNQIILIKKLNKITLYYYLYIWSYIYICKFISFKNFHHYWEHFRDIWFHRTQLLNQCWSHVCWRFLRVLDTLRWEIFEVSWICHLLLRWIEPRLMHLLFAIFLNMDIHVWHLSKNKSFFCDPLSIILKAHHAKIHLYIR